MQSGRWLGEFSGLEITVLDDFGATEEVHGNLVLQSTLQDISGLANLKVVTGELVIGGSSTLANCKF